MNGYHVFMQHGRGGPRFTGEARSCGTARGQVGSKNLDGDIAIKRRLKSFQYNSHATTTHDAGDLIAAKASHHPGVVRRVKVVGDP